MRGLLRLRPEPLGAAAALAAAFVVLRVVYRGLFGGLDRGGTLLLDLPSWRLPPPIDHVIVLGPITSGGLTTAVTGAVPIAAVILGFGVVNAILDVPALCARLSHGGPLRSVGQALVIAWAAFPGLVRSVGDVRRARRLRGERGVASLLVPVMERTVERAVALGASMEVRGFAASAGSGDAAVAARASEASGAPGEPAGPAVELVDVAISHTSGWAVTGDLTLPRGGLVLLAGPTGSGKSTLLRAISGLHQHVDGGRVTGTIRVLGIDRGRPPHATAPLVGVVPQQPRLSFVAETVLAEIAFAGQVQGARNARGRAEADRRAAAAADRFGVADLLTARTADLSAGQAHLVALASAVAHQPALLLVDEPLADLDEAARHRVVAALVRLAADGVTVIVAEHRGAQLRRHADVVVTLETDGAGARLASEDRAASTADARVSHAPAEPTDPPPPVAVARDRPALLRVRGLDVDLSGTPVLRDVSLDVAAGEVVAITGEVGSGKTTLLGAVALPRRGTVEVDGQDLARLGRRTRLRHAALVPDASDDLLFRLTVAEECARADRVARATAGSTAARFLGFLGVVELTDPDHPASSLLVRHPRDLSVGQRRLLVLAVQLAAEPRVLLVDEPSRGLDPNATHAVRQALMTTAAAGTAVVLATHDAGFAALADRVLRLDGGALTDRLDATTETAR